MLSQERRWADYPAHVIRALEIATGGDRTAIEKVLAGNAKQCFTLISPAAS